ncbi:MAG: ssb, partial [Gemmatimonadetes bacterium]|nr:ssb [Gemmatimonadota bacterium]
KGDKIYVEGRIEYRQWQDKENQTRYTTEINVRELIMLSGKAGGSDSFESDSSGGSNSRPRAAATDRARGAGAGAGTGAAGGDFEDFRGNLDTEDDDLPF